MSVCVVTHLLLILSVAMTHKKVVGTLANWPLQNKISNRSHTIASLHLIKNTIFLQLSLWIAINQCQLT